MNKRFLLTAIVLLAGVSVMRADRDKLHDALEASDLPTFKKHIRRETPLSKRDKKQLLEEAEDVIDIRKANLSMFRSRWDALKFVGGGLLGSIGLVVSGIGVMGVANRDDTTISSAFAIAGGIATFYGFYKCVRGFMCQTAKERLTAAQKIEDEIDKADVIGANKEVCNPEKA